MDSGKVLIIIIYCYLIIIIIIAIIIIIIIIINIIFIDSAALNSDNQVEIEMKKQASLYFRGKTSTKYFYLKGLMEKQFGNEDFWGRWENRQKNS